VSLQHVHDHLLVHHFTFFPNRYDGKTKHGHDKNVYAAAKQNYGETRGLSNRIDSKYKKKLKRSLKQLEELMQQKKIVYCAWKNHNILQMMFCTGLLAYIAINVQSGDLINIVFDKFLTDKLISDTITDGETDFCALCVSIL
jgi:WD repeat-containing and planar cell polarity effector protein Fritz